MKGGCWAGWPELVTWLGFPWVASWCTHALPERVARLAQSTPHDSHRASPPQIFGVAPDDLPPSLRAEMLAALQGKSNAQIWIARANAPACLGLAPRIGMQPALQGARICLVAHLLGLQQEAGS